MKPAYFEVIHPDYHDDGNPYSATLLPDERIPDEPDQQRIRRLRNWLIALALAIGCSAIIGYIIFGLYSSAKAAGLQEHMKILTILIVADGGVGTIIYISFMVVVYRLSRALGNSRGMSILYLVLSTFSIGVSNQVPVVGRLFIMPMIPLGAVIITFVLYVQAQNALLDQQPDETDSF